MAVMGRRKKAVAQRWNAINKQREEENQPQQTKEETISKEEHEERLNKLKELGLIK